VAAEFNAFPSDPEYFWPRHQRRGFAVRRVPVGKPASLGPQVVRGSDLFQFKEPVKGD